MNELILTALIFLPVILAAGASAVSWRRISNRVLFLVVSVLLLFGLQSLVAPVATTVFLPSGGGITLAAANVYFAKSVQLSAAIQLVVGTPVLWWLYRAFRKP